MKIFKQFYTSVGTIFYNNIQSLVHYFFQYSVTIYTSNTRLKCTHCERVGKRVVFGVWLLVVHLFVGILEEGIGKVGRCRVVSATVEFVSGFGVPQPCPVVIVIVPVENWFANFRQLTVWEKRRNHCAIK